eukprot:3921363-Prorocentrum_lima.AAC.1
MEKQMAVIEKEKALYQFESECPCLPCLSGYRKDEPVCQEAVYGVPLSAHYAWQSYGDRAGRTVVRRV